MPIVSRLLANGNFQTGDFQLDEINNNKFQLDNVNQKIYANTFDEVTINSSLVSTIYSADVSKFFDWIWDAYTNANQSNFNIINPQNVTQSVPYIFSDTSLSAIHAMQKSVFINNKEGTASIFAKADTVRYFNLTLDDAGSNGFFGTFDALTGNIIGTGVNVGTVIGATSKYYGNGWWRFSISGKINPATNLSRFSINILGTATNGWFPSTIITSGLGMYFTFLQLERRPWPSTLVLNDLPFSYNIPFSNTPMRLESTNELFVNSEFDEVTVIT